MQTQKSRIFKVSHEEPKHWGLGFILLPYGAFYDKTKPLLKAKKGDILRFYNGGDHEIFHITLIKQDKYCDMLCRIRYNIPWSVALRKWQSYAVIEGHGKGVISTEECFLILYV